MVWIQFLACAFFIVLAGIRLTTYADALGDRLGIGRAWIGVVVLGFVTSLPEAVSSLTAVISLGAADLAVGNMVGSNNFNLVLLVVMDLVCQPGAVTNRIGFNRSTVLPALVSMVLVGLVGIELAGGLGWLLPGQISLGLFLVMAGYLVGVRFLSMAAAPSTVEVPPGSAARRQSLAVVAGNVLGSAVVVVLAAVWLAKSADQLAAVTGLGRTFVGTAFLALVTSLPEMVVTVSAVRLGALDLAVGNIFGSNMINMFLVAVCDLFYRPGGILAAVSPRHLVAVVSSLALTAIALAGLRWPGKRAYAGLGPDSWAILGLFLLSLGILYRLGVAG